MASQEKQGKREGRRGLIEPKHRRALLKYFAEGRRPTGTKLPAGQKLPRGFRRVLRQMFSGNGRTK